MSETEIKRRVKERVSRDADGLSCAACVSIQLKECEEKAELVGCGRQAHCRYRWQQRRAVVCEEGGGDLTDLFDGEGRQDCGPLAREKAEAPEGRGEKETSGQVLDKFSKVVRLIAASAGNVKILKFSLHRAIGREENYEEETVERNKGKIV